jgi:ribosomal protein S15P/S13E
MGLTEEELIKTFARHSNDVGSPEVKYIKLAMKHKKVMKHYKNGGGKDKPSVRHAMRLSGKMSRIASYLRKAFPKKFKKMQKLL